MTRLTWICLVILATAAVTIPTWSVFRTGATPQKSIHAGLDATRAEDQAAHLRPLALLSEKDRLVHVLR